MLSYEPRCGTHIQGAAVTARTMAREARRPVRLRFNGVVLVATRKTSVASLLWTFDLVMSQHAQAYRTSRRGIEQAKRRKQQIADNQQQVDFLCRMLASAIRNGLSDVVLWCAEFSEAADDIGVKYSPSTIARQLTEAGYVDNQHCGRPEADFSNAQVLGEFIVGQAINCLNHAMPPHPMTRRYAKRYAELAKS
jgi:hypothetical protein